jgi:hypothetical protein
MKSTTAALATIFSIGCALVGNDFAFAQSCKTVQEVEAEIIMCGENYKAVEHTAKCLSLVESESKVVIAQLSQAMSSRDRRLIKGVIQSSADQIKLMLNQSETAGHYAQAMIDTPGSTSAATSLPCFNKNFEKLQELIDKMDDAISKTQDKYDSIVTTSKHLEN